MNLDILKAPTPPDEIQWRVRSVTKDETRCSIIAYVDARYMQARLNEAFGVGGWSVRHEVVDPEKHVVMTTLTVHDMGAGTARLTADTGDTIKQDFGYPNSANDEEPLKSAASDGLKRCCVHLGLTHDIYAMEARWVAYDAQKKQPIMDGREAQSSAPSPSTTPAAATGPTAWPSWAPKACPSCGAGTILREGIKDGKAWAGAMCDGPKRPGEKYKGCGAKPTFRPDDWHEQEAVENSLTDEDKARIEQAELHGSLVDTIREVWGHRGYLSPPAQAGSLHKWLAEQGFPMRALPESVTSKVVNEMLAAMSPDILARYSESQEEKRDVEE